MIEGIVLGSIILYLAVGYGVTRASYVVDARMSPQLNRPGVGALIFGNFVWPLLLIYLFCMGMKYVWVTPDFTNLGETMKKVYGVNNDRAE